MFDPDSSTYSKDDIEAQLSVLDDDQSIEFIPVFETFAVPNDPQVSQAWYIDQVQANLARQA